MIYDICGYLGVADWNRNVRNFPRDKKVTNGRSGLELFNNTETSCEWYGGSHGAYRHPIFTYLYIQACARARKHAQTTHTQTQTNTQIHM
jgi:hypothetical protein